MFVIIDIGPFQLADIEDLVCSAPTSGLYGLITPGEGADTVQLSGSLP